MTEITEQFVEQLILGAMGSLRAYGVHELTLDSQTPRDQREWLRGYSAALTAILHYMTGQSYSDIIRKLNERTEDPTR